MDLLWPHSSARAARNNLNVAVHGLRRSLEVGGPGPHVVFKDGCYMLSPALDVWFDVAEFEAERERAQHHRRHGPGQEPIAEARAGFARMAQLYQGELFADDTAGEWFLSTRRLLEEQFAEALEVIAEEAHASGDEVTCVDTCHRLLTVDPCREPAHRLLMVAYTAQGLYHLAARQYAVCVTSLQEELDVCPSSRYNGLVPVSAGAKRLKQGALNRGPPQNKRTIRAS